MKGRISSQAGEAGSIGHDFDDKLVIGRGASSDLVLPLPTVSGSHASVTYDPAEGAFMLEDLNSTHGTSLDGTPVSGRERLDHLNVISLAGTVDLLFQDLQKCTLRHGENISGAKSIKSAKPDNVASSPPAKAASPSKSPSPASPPASLEQSDQPPAPPAPPAPPTEPQGDGAGTMIGQMVPPPVVQADAEPPSESTVHAVALPPELHHDETPLSAPPPLPPPGEVEGNVSVKDERTTIGDPLSGPAAPSLPDSDPDSAAQIEKGAAVQRVRLVFSQSVEGENQYSLKPGENSVGRGVSSDVPRKRAEVSRNHAVITLRDGKVWVRDCGSSLGTKINDEPVTGEVEMEVGATISFGIDDARLEAE